jgi:DNA polymerase-3 subunit delta'
MLADPRRLPWHESCWAQLDGYISSQRIPHALMLTGPEGVGKGLLAEQFAQRLLCEAPLEAKTCGHCHACKLISAGTHPDYIVISPEEEKKTISIDRIRALGQTLTLKPHYAKYRVVIITPADTLNRNAANALLKTLEEPGENSLFLLVTDQRALLPATIYSRCQLLNISLPEQKAAISWLNEKQVEGDAKRLLSFAAGAPFKACQLANSEVLKEYELLESLWLALIKGQIDPVTAVSKVDKIGLNHLIEWISRWVIELIQIQFDAEGKEANRLEINKILKDCKGGLNLKGLFDLLEALLEAKKRLNSQLNRQLMLEAIFISWSNINK